MPPVDNETGRFDLTQELSLPFQLGPVKMVPYLKGTLAEYTNDLNGDTIGLTDMKGSIAGSPVTGRLSIGMQQPPTIDGAIDLGTIDLAGAVATVVGIPVRAQPARSDVIWQTEPFEGMLGPVSGEVAVNAARVTLTPKLEARGFKGIARFGESRFALQATAGSVAGGRLAGELILLREREGVVARARIRLAGANAAALLPGDGAIAGRLTFEATAEGTGMSPAALIGSLEGSGTFTLESGRIVRLDPKAFEAVTRAVDQGLPIDLARLRDRTESALSGGALALARSEGAITIAAGQARPLVSSP